MVGFGRSVTTLLSLVVIGAADSVRGSSIEEETATHDEIQETLNTIGIECQQLDPAFKLPDDFLYSTSTTPLGNITLVINADSHVHGVEPLDDYADDKTAIPDVIVVNGTPYTIPPITEVDTVCDECKNEISVPPGHWIDDKDNKKCLCYYEKVTLAALYVFVIFYVFGFMMNAALVWGISNTKISRPSNIYIINLALADFIITLLLPFMHSELVSNYWDYGLFFCKALYFFDFLVMFCAQWFLLLIAYDRYLLLEGVPTFERIRRAKRLSTMVWIVSLAFSSFNAIYTTLSDDWVCGFNTNSPNRIVWRAMPAEAQCYNSHELNFEKHISCESRHYCHFMGFYGRTESEELYQTVTGENYTRVKVDFREEAYLASILFWCLICYLLPILITIVLYTYIWWTIDKYKEIRRRMINKYSYNDDPTMDEENLRHEIATQHILVIELCSFVFWLPFWVIRVFLAFKNMPGREQVTQYFQSQATLHYLNNIPIYLAYVNTVANPFVYGWMNRALRRELVLNEVVLNRFFTKTKVEITNSEDGDNRRIINARNTEAQAKNKNSTHKTSLKTTPTPPAYPNQNQ